MYCYSCTVCSFTKRCIDLLTVVYCYIFVCFLLWFYLNNGWWLSLAINIADISSLVCYDCFVQFLSPFNLELNSDIAYSISSFVIFYHPHGNVKGDVCIYLYTEYVLRCSWGCHMFYCFQQTCAGKFFVRSPPSINLFRSSTLKRYNTSIELMRFWGTVFQVVLVRRASYVCASEFSPLPAYIVPLTNSPRNIRQ